MGGARTQRQKMWATLFRNRVSVAGIALAIGIAAGSAAAPLVTSWSPVVQDPIHRLRPPGGRHLLGQDTFGRDVFARILYGGRVSLLVGVGAVELGGTVGTALGLTAGYYGGRTETLLMRFVDILMAFPSLLLGLIVLAVLGPGLGKMIFAIGIVLSPPFARIAHGTTLSLVRQEFVDAARAAGAGAWRILLSGLLAAGAIRIEASLSFIGLGVSPPTPTWGNMIREGTPYLIDSPWLSVAPGIAILLAVLAFNLVGDALRDVIDPRLRV
ncbi:MAG: ABC transporter permease [Bacillati bacterium ANGP1]|uniref:ABC transporter permease n=1 Tax=Candidatus Segetimicrobium genomatis TaxID=2569760 RepID=A0A537M7W4_9BACT|nr:MAG: ABC transporter permease [Terrabacteria group bacterium ANGP1]